MFFIIKGMGMDGGGFEKFFQCRNMAGGRSQFLHHVHVKFIFSKAAVNIFQYMAGSDFF